MLRIIFELGIFSPVRSDEINMFQDNFDFKYRAGFGILGAIGFLWSIDNVNRMDNDALTRDVTRVAKVFNERPAGDRQTKYGVFGARPEGTTLVFTVEKMPSSLALEAERFLQPIAEGIACEAGPLKKIIESGATVRLETTTITGRSLEPVEVHECK